MYGVTANNEGIKGATAISYNYMKDMGDSISVTTKTYVMFANK